MSSPVAAETVLVRPDAVAALADELTVLAAELTDDAARCRTAAGLLSAGLDGHEGWVAAAAATAWAALEEVLAEQTTALARTMTGAVRAYFDGDAGVAAELGAGGSGMPR